MFVSPSSSFCSFVPSVQTQRDGLIFIYDMTNSSYGNFDYELCVKILNLLKVNTNEKRPVLLLTILVLKI